VSDIFVSYASEDKARIKPLVEALQQHGWTIWWDRTILAGKIWEREIEAALAGSRCVIVVWSEASVQSDWVWTEADEGKRRGILVPVLLDLVTIPLAFRRIHAANLVGWNGETANSEFEELARAVTALLGSSAPLAAGGTGATQTAGGSTARLTDVHAPAEPILASTFTKASESPPADKGRRPEATPAEEERTIWSSISTLAFGPRRRTLVLGAFGLVCIIGLGWYFASTRHNTEPSVTPTKPAPQTLAAGEIKVNSKDNLRYAWIRPGKFMMGCSLGDSQCYDDEKPAHEVGISLGFWLGQTEVTQAAYQAVTRKPNPSHFNGNDLPVEEVSYDEAKSYCEAVGMRLPTEAEWEYAARAGSTAGRYGDLDQVAWYSGNSAAGGRVGRLRFRIGAYRSSQRAIVERPTLQLAPTISSSSSP
jgi:hypothetical protein